MSRTATKRMTSKDRRFRRPHIIICPTPGCYWRGQPPGNPTQTHKARCPRCDKQLLRYLRPNHEPLM